MKMNKIWMVACMAATFIGGVYGCDDDKDFSYEGQLDLNLLNLTQARDVWDGAECNVITALQQSEDETPVKNFTYKLSLSLYQERTAGKEAKVSLVVNKDTLNKVLAKVSEGGIYAKYDGAELLPESFYHLSSPTLTLQAGETKSDAVSVTVYSSELIAACQEAERNLLYLLPLTIESSSSYGINPKTNTLMLLFNVSYVKPVEPEDQEAYVADKVGVADDHTLENGMQLLWHDEFNGTGEPDGNIWRFETGFQRNEEDQWYQKDNAQMKEGALCIEGRQEAVKNPNYQAGSSDWKKNREYSEYTSSCIVVKDAYVFKYGRMEVRAKIPVAQGAWPAIWMLPEKAAWPSGGEIDIMERLNNDSIAYQTVHSHYTYTLGITENPKSHSTGPIYPDRYNVYAVEMYPDSLSFYINDMHTFTYPRIQTKEEGQYPFNQPFYLLIDMQLGGSWVGAVGPEDLPVEMEVDWVHFYQRKSKK